jgi:hypothetical protein
MKGIAMLKSRTLWFAALLAALSVVQGNIAQLALDPQTQMIIGCVVAAAIAVLRAITTQPLADR